jgi:subtilisin
MTRPAWSDPFERAALTPVNPLVSETLTREWAWDGADGAGVRVAIVDSGIDGDHPAVNGVTGAVAIDVDRDTGAVEVTEGPHADLFGHGTACAGIVRRVAPAAELYSVRVLGPTLKGTGAALIAGLRWAIDNDMHVVNLSLSTRSRDHFAALHELADDAYFRGTVLVSAVNNVLTDSYPSLYSSVVSVAASDETDPFSIAYNPAPPVEFGAPGIDVDVAWSGGATVRSTGNSFAAAHVTGLVARLLSKHPGLVPFQVKTVLHAIADNARHQ